MKLTEEPGLQVSEEQHDGLKRVVTFIVILFSAFVIAILGWGMMMASEDF